MIKAYACAKAVIKEGNLVIVDCRIYSEPASSLTLLMKEIYLEIISINGNDYDEAWKNTYNALESIGSINPCHKICFEFVKKNNEVQKKMMADGGLMFADSVNLVG